MTIIIFDDEKKDFEILRLHRSMIGYINTLYYIRIDIRPDAVEVEGIAYSHWSCVLAERR